MLYKQVKHNRGKDLMRDQVWVFGMRERHTSKCYFEIVADRERRTLLRIIMKHVNPGSIIYSDNWSAYNEIGRLNFTHEFVNHSLHFVKPGTDVHTNGIESLWNACKSRFRKMRGYSRSHLQTL